MLSDRRVTPTVNARQVLTERDVTLVSVVLVLVADYGMIDFRLGYFQCSTAGNFPDRFLNEQGKYFQCRQVNGG